MTKEDNNIVGLIRNRNEKGLSILYDKYSKPIFGIVLRIISQHGLAEEILQQTMLKAWNKIETFDGTKSSLFTWLSVIARNTAIDKKRLKSYENTENTKSFNSESEKISVESNYSGLDVNRLLSS